MGFGGFQPHAGMVQVLVPEDLVELVGAVLANPDSFVQQDGPVGIVEVAEGQWVRADQIVAVLTTPLGVTLRLAGGHHVPVPGATAEQVLQNIVRRMEAR